MKGRIEVEIGIRVHDVPPEEAEAFLLAFAKIAANSHGVVNINPQSQKVIQGMPAVQKALQAAPPAPTETRESMRESELERRAERRRDLEAKKEEAKAVKRLERDAVLKARESEIRAKHEQQHTFRAKKEQRDMDEVSAALDATRYCVKEAAQKLGITPAGLYHRMQRLGFYTRKQRGGTDV